MFEPKVMTCGNYKCEHCNPNGRCTITKISINTEGRCNQYLPKRTKRNVDNDPDKEFYPHTNIC